MSLTEFLIGVAVAVVGGVIAFFAGGRSTNRKRDADQSKASLDAELNRRKLDDDIDQDTDLATRARNAGLVRRDRSE